MAQHTHSGPEEAESPSEGIASRILDMTEVNISDLARFRHPRLAQAKADLAEIVSGRRVAAGFGSAL